MFMFAQSDLFTSTDVFVYCVSTYSALAIFRKSRRLCKRKIARVSLVYSYPHYS